ncbi:MAG: hypothetical protein EOM05_07730 [Clostridia bacterium]|nr:hypothetical protein [Clostridia bacterium]
MDFKKVMKILSIVLSIAAAVGVVYVFVQRYLNNRSIEADNKLQYASFGSENDEFISEEKLA